MWGWNSKTLHGKEAADRGDILENAEIFDEYSYGRNLTQTMQIKYNKRTNNLPINGQMNCPESPQVKQNCQWIHAIISHKGSAN